MRNPSTKTRLALLTLAFGLSGASTCKAADDTVYYPTCLSGYGDSYAGGYVSFANSTFIYAGNYAAFLEDTDFNNCISWAQSGAAAIGGRWAAGNSYWVEQG
jgi:hypothetical protein